MFCNALAEDLTALHRERDRDDEWLRERFGEMRETIVQRYRQEADERQQSLWEQNRLLREEVKTLARTLGMRPVKVQGDTYVQTPKLLNDPSASDAHRAVRLIVMDQIEEVFEENAEFGPDQIRDYIKKSIRGSMEATVRQAAGIEDRYGSRSMGKDSVFGRKLREAVQPHVDDAIKEILPGIIDKLELPTEPEEWMLAELRDEFVKSLRTHLRDEVRARAEKMAREALTKEVDQILLDEFPALRRRLAMARLGKPEKQVG
jgi:hypothetical protein